MNWIIETIATIASIALIALTGVIAGSEMERRAQEWQRMERKENARKRREN